MDDKLGKVLIVDDDIHINELIDMYLQSGGYSTKKCFNGNDACNIVMTEDIGLVILDVMLPGKDGIDVLKHIRKNSDIPVMFGVVTTDNIEQAIERAGTKAGNKGFDCAVGAIEMVNLIREIEV